MEFTYGKKKGLEGYPKTITTNGVKWNVWWFTNAKSAKTVMPKSVKLIEKFGGTAKIIKWSNTNEYPYALIYKGVDINKIPKAEFAKYGGK